MHTKQDRCGTYFKQNRHGTDMDTKGIEENRGAVHTFRVDTDVKCLHVTNTSSRMTVSRGERKLKLDRSKRESKGATNEAPICAVPMHAP